VIFLLGYQSRSGGRSALDLQQSRDAATLHDDVGRLQEAVDRLEAGDAGRARELAEDVLDRRPTSDAAHRILTAAVAAEGSPTPTTTPTPTSASRPSRGRMAGRAPPTTPMPEPTATSTPGPSPAVLEIMFDTPLSEGSLVVEADFERVDEIRWDLSDDDAMPSGREVQAELEIPVGTHQLEIQLHAGRRGQIGMEVFERDFEPGSRWRVVVELPDRRARPSFVLERIGMDW
jgi:hypothetical protein